MTPIKQYIANMFIGKTFHFKCDCVIPIDVIGTVCDTTITQYEIVLLVNTNKKIIKIGLNTPSLTIEEL
jgi:hypothetical protein